MENPRVSVVMAVYNGGRFLKAAIDSILAQTLEGFEFIIVDDGSTDDSGKLLDAYEDHRIVLRHKLRRNRQDQRRGCDEE